MKMFNYILLISIGNAIAHFALFFILPDYTMEKVRLNIVFFLLILTVFCLVANLFGWRPYGMAKPKKVEPEGSRSGEIGENNGR